MNEVRLKGRVAKDFECMGTDKKFCFMVIACDREFSNDADFIDVKVFGELAESCAQVLKKGDLVSVTGRIGKSSYEKNGQKIYTTAVIADSVTKLKRGASSVSAKVVEESEEVDA